jgi:hypothetical protein
MMGAGFVLMLAAATTDARAGTVVLGTSGWQATWDPSLDLLVNVASLNVTAETITVSKSAIFDQPPNQSGLIPPILIVFQQIAESTISSIAIENEVVINGTGVDWTDFHFDVIGGDATFNPTATNASGPNGFVVTPFTSSVFTADNTRLDVSGGLVANGDSWFPGSGANGGALWINVVSGPVGNFRFFTLKETPTIPGPTALAVLALGFIVMPLRRRMS